MFRAKRKDGQGEVKGWLNYDKVNDRYFIVDEFYYTYDYDCWLPNIIEVIPSTIAIKTGQLDKANEMIYGSFELDGFGMTKGGDVVAEKNGFKTDIIWGVYNDHEYVECVECWMCGYMPLSDVLFDKRNEYKIIGKQYDGEV